MKLSNPIDDIIPSVDGRVSAVLARSGIPLTGARVAEAAGASKERVRQVLARLVDAGLVTSQPAGQAILYAANREHLLWPAVQKLIVDTDQFVYLIKQRIVEVLEQGIGDSALAGQCMLALFGSVARGEATGDSDIDVLLIAPDELDPQTTTSLVSEIVDSVMTGTGNECNVYAVSRSGFDELVADEDPMVGSWVADAAVFHGPDFRRRLRGASWDEQ